jgi:hypothetical protein
MRRSNTSIAVFCLLAIVIAPAARASLVAAYTFNNTFNAVQGGVAALTSVNPLGTGAFQTVTVFGHSQTTWHFDGAASPPTNQGGLQFNTTGLISSNVYSVEMVFELTGSAGWRRLMDSLDRQSDNGLYIDPNNNLDVFPQGGTSSPFTANTFFDVFVTVDAANNVTGYFGGVQQFTETSTNLDIATNTLGFFLDNVAGGGQGEWSSGNVALIKVFNTALTAQQVAAEAADPFQGTTGTAPEPGTYIVMLGGLAAFAAVKRAKLI